MNYHQIKPCLIQKYFKKQFMKFRFWDSQKKQMLYDSELYKINYYDLFIDKNRYIALPFIAKLKAGDCFVGDIISCGNNYYEVMKSGIRLLDSKIIKPFLPKNMAFKVRGNIFANEEFLIYGGVEMVLKSSLN
jgi:hypothetical protein